MATYIPRYFTGEQAEALQLIRNHPFATLVTAVDGREPQVTHLPLFVEGDMLIGHFARPNPHAGLLLQGQTVAVFHGPHAYVSPRWYAEPEQHVPTWNFASVHVSGKPQLLDEAGTRQAVLTLTELFEQGRWKPTQEKLERLVGGVIGFRMPIERLDVKFKMNQNRSAADRAGVIAALGASERADDVATAEWMQAHEWVR
jgi:transcriptional regulator